jgi:hypothetical protein
MIPETDLSQDFVEGWVVESSSFNNEYRTLSSISSQKNAALSKVHPGTVGLRSGEHLLVGGM